VKPCASKEANSSSSASMLVGLGMRLGRRIGLENSPTMAQRQTKAERLLTKRPSRALHGFGNLLDRRLASRVCPQLSHVCL
jgi:hypothetical protein